MALDFVPSRAPREIGGPDKIIDSSNFPPVKLSLALMEEGSHSIIIAFWRASLTKGKFALREIFIHEGSPFGLK
jgi:hypothetical protein